MKWDVMFELFIKGNV